MEGLATCSLLGVWRPASFSFSLSLSRSFAWRWLILPGVRRTVSSPHATAATDREEEREPRKVRGEKERTRCHLTSDQRTSMQTADFHNFCNICFHLCLMTGKRKCFVSADNLNMCPCALSLHLVYLVLMKLTGMLFLGNGSTHWLAKDQSTSLKLKHELHLS